MLTEAGAVAYMLQQGFLTRADVVRDDLRVQDASRRNRNLIFRRNDGAGFFLKQSDVRQSIKTLRREAEIYRLLWKHRYDFASRHMPRLRWVDPTNEVLVLDCLDSVQPLDTVQARNPVGAMACAAELGRALARLHSSDLEGRLSMAAPPPWVCSVHKPGQELLSDLSSGAISTIKIIQETPGFGNLLADLLRSRAESAMTHGDIRWDNCLVRFRDGSESPESVFIVDWELAGIGDPCWDIGGVFCEYLSLWIRSLPVTTSLSLADSLRLAACPLDVIQPRLARFWSSYADQRATSHQSGEFFLRAVRLSGARLVQSAIEAARTSSQLTAAGVYSLQLAKNLLLDPVRAASHLLHLSIPR